MKVAGLNAPTVRAFASGRCVLELDGVSLKGVSCDDTARIVVRSSTVTDWWSLPQLQKPCHGVHCCRASVIHRHKQCLSDYLRFPVCAK